MNQWAEAAGPADWHSEWGWWCLSGKCTRLVLDPAVQTQKWPQICCFVWKTDSCGLSLLQVVGCLCYPCCRGLCFPEGVQVIPEAPSRHPSSRSIWCGSSWCIPTFVDWLRLLVCPRSNKGINNMTTRCLWFFQTFLFGFASLGLLLKYKPERRKKN